MTADAKYTAGNLAYAEAVHPRWPVSVRLTARIQARNLLDALELYEDIQRDRTHESSVYDDLVGPEYKHEALERAAQAIQDLTSELVRAFPACAVTATDGSDEGQEAA